MKPIVSYTEGPHKSILNTQELEFIARMVRETVSLGGDILELGCYLGGTSLFISEVSAMEACNRRVIGLDTFAGFPVDDTHGNYKAGDFVPWETLDVHNRLLLNPDIDHNRVIFLRGPFENTLPLLADHRFSLVFFDCDIYPSLLTGLKFVRNRLTEGARLLFHDYGYAECPGVKPFVDEFIRPNYQFVDQCLDNLLAFENR